MSNQNLNLTKIPSFVKRRKGGTFSFPGSNPVSISRNDLSTLSGSRYYICEKTEGHRALLWLQDTATAVFFDRNMTPTPPKAYGISLTYDAKYAETLLDGEIAWNWQRGLYVFLVFDVLQFCKKPLVNETFPCRINTLTIDFPFTECSQVQYKHFFELKPSNKSLYEHHLSAAQRSYCVDGAIMTPEKLPIKAGRNWKLFKWKPRLQNTVDLRVESDMKAFVCDSDASVATIDPDQRSSVQPGLIYECQWLRDNLWSIVKLRNDKTDANDSTTFRNTVTNIHENIQVNELFGTSYTTKDVDEICKLLTPYKTNKLDSNTNLEIEFRFEKISKTTYLQLFATLSTCRDWCSVERTHTIDNCKGQHRWTTNPNNTNESCVFNKKKLASHQLSDKSIKCVISTEEKVQKGVKEGLCREKRRISFVYDDHGLLWSYDLSCINPCGEEPHWEVELECKAFREHHDHKYIVESGLMKCRDLVEIMC